MNQDASLLDTEALRNAGPQYLADVTNEFIEALNDKAKNDDLVAFLVDLANRPRSENETHQQMETDAFTLVCTAYAVLTLAEHYSEAEEEKASAAWFRSLARTFLFHAANRWTQDGLRKALNRERRRKGQTRH